MNPKNKSGTYTDEAKLKEYMKDLILDGIEKNRYKWINEKVSSSRIIISYPHPVSSSRIIIPYHHPASSSRIIIPYRVQRNLVRLSHSSKREMGVVTATLKIYSFAFLVSLSRIITPHPHLMSFCRIIIPYHYPISPQQRFHCCRTLLVGGLEGPAEQGGVEALF